MQNKKPNKQTSKHNTFHIPAALDTKIMRPDFATTTPENLVLMFFKKNVLMENIELLSTDLKGSNEKTVLNDNTDELDNMIDCIVNDTNIDKGDDNEESIIEAVELDAVEIAVDTSDCNKYGLCDIWKEGKLKMIKCDYVNRRKLEKIRMVRMNIFIEGIYNRVKDRETNNNNMNTSISRLHNLLNGNVQLQKTQGMHQHYDRI
jgi:hypothetical protein